MKKQIMKSLASGLLVLLTLAGCSTVNVNLNIKANGTASLTETVSIQKSSFKTSNQTTAFITQVQKAAKEATDGMKTIVSENKNNVIINETFTGKWNQVTKTNNGLTIVKKNNEITVSLPVNKLINQITDNKVGTKKSFQKTFNSFKITVMFPGGVEKISNNGKIDGKTATWTASQVFNSLQNKTPLQVRGLIKGAAPGFNFIPIIVGLLLILLVGGGFVGAWKFYKKKVAEEKGNVQPKKEKNTTIPDKVKKPKISKTTKVNRNQKKDNIEENKNQQKKLLKKEKNTTKLNDKNLPADDKVNENKDVNKKSKTDKKLKNIDKDKTSRLTKKFFNPDKKQKVVQPTLEKAPDSSTLPHFETGNFKMDDNTHNDRSKSSVISPSEATKEEASAASVKPETSSKAKLPPLPPLPPQSVPQRSSVPISDPKSVKPFPLSKPLPKKQEPK